MCVVDLLMAKAYGVGHWTLLGLHVLWKRFPISAVASSKPQLLPFTWQLSLGKAPFCLFSVSFFSLDISSKIRGPPVVHSLHQHLLLQPPFHAM